MALYLNCKPREGPPVEDLIFMPHEDVIETSFEEDRIKAIKKTESL